MHDEMSVPIRIFLMQNTTVLLKDKTQAMTVWMLLISFSYFIALAGTFSTTLKGSDINAHPCPVVRLPLSLFL